MPAVMWAPPMDVTETKDVLAFKEEQKDKNYHRVERAYGRFYRSFALPVNLDVSKVSATLADGVLNVELPKREEAKPRSIPSGPTRPSPSGPAAK